MKSVEELENIIKALEEIKEKYREGDDPKESRIWYAAHYKLVKYERDLEVVKNADAQQVLSIELIMRGIKL